MRKSNWVIIAILVIASIVFLAMWHTLEFNLIDDTLDLVLTIVWWVVIIGVCIAINWAEKRRRRSLRTSFIAPGLVYNPEAGIVKVADDDAYVAALQKILTNLNYDFEKTDVSNDKRIRFKYIVRTDSFSNKGNKWTGEVVKVSNPDDVHHFHNKQELSKLIEAA